MISKIVGTFICIAALFVVSISAQRVPAVSELEEVAQLPAEVPQRVGALAFDGKKLWFATYAGRGAYATYDPVSKNWDTTQDQKLKDAIARNTGRSQSAGGMVFVDGKIWVASSSGESFGSIDLADPTKHIAYERFHNSALIGTTSQSYSDMTFDGNHLWLVWHGFYYKPDGTKTQLLFKIDKNTGDVLAEFPLTERERQDGAHGLAWDGHSLWHAKGKWLTEYDAEGKKRSEVRLEKVTRPSGLAWDGKSLWIAEFGGKLWRLPMKSA